MALAAGGNGAPLSVVAAAGAAVMGTLVGCLGVDTLLLGTPVVGNPVVGTPAVGTLVVGTPVVGILVVDSTVLLMGHMVVVEHWPMTFSVFRNCH